MDISQEIFSRTKLLVGQDSMTRISEARVIIFGVGGVGSWCAESLIRSGIRFLTIVDSDKVCPTNVNRQLMATTETVGQIKVEVLKERLLQISPLAQINTMQSIYCAENLESFSLDSYDYIIDAIDSLQHKVHLLIAASKTQATVFSSMGAALKINPSRIKVAEFWKVNGCPLGAALRRKMKKIEKPAKKIMCVYSDELLENAGANEMQQSPDLPKEEWSSKKAQINGTFVHITAIFGFTLASLVVQDCVQKNR